MVKKIIRFATDTALEAAASYGLNRGEQVLRQINVRPEETSAFPQA
jgi:hypothetical protein